MSMVAVGCVLTSGVHQEHCHDNRLDQTDGI